MGQTQNIQSPQPTTQNVFTPQDIHKLYKRFKKLDTNGDGHIEKRDLDHIPGIGNNPLLGRIIATFDKNGNNKISFMEFINGLATLSTGTDEQAKNQFAFNIYDFDGDGKISTGDLTRVVKMIVGDNLTDAQLKQLVESTMQQADNDKDGYLNFEEFKNIVKYLDIRNKLSLNYS